MSVLAADPAAAAELALELLAETTLAGDLEVDRALVGGLSGLTYDPGCDLFYAVSDDRGAIAPPRFFTLTIGLGAAGAEVEVLGATLLRDADGVPFARGDLDPEAVALAADGTLYLATEGVPHRGVPPMVGLFQLDGGIRGTLSLPQHYLGGADGRWGVHDNHGFEGLSLSPDGKWLFVATESSLIQDGPPADLERGAMARLLRFDVATGQLAGEYLYRVEPVPDVPRPASAYASTGVSEILAVDGHRVVVVERSFSAGVGNRVRLYLVELEGAPDIRGLASIREVADPGSLQAPKRLFADLRDLGVDPDNIEGLALGPALDDGRRLLVLISDNNFQPSVQDNQVLLFALAGLPPPVSGTLKASVAEIQGAGHVSPVVGRCVSGIEGLVTVILGSRGGQAFWIQDSPGDGDPSTSEGLFVLAVDGLASVEVGDRVRLGGRVEEPAWGLELPVTRLFATSLEVTARRQPLPAPVVIGEGGVPIPQPDIASPGFAVFEPDRYAADAFESLEGMLVRVEMPVVVGPTSRYGEFVVLADGGCGAVQRTDRGGLRLLADNTNPQRIVIDDRLVADPPALDVGARLAGPVDGVLHSSFGSYKVFNYRPLPDVLGGGLVRERTIFAGDSTHLTVATFNLANLSAVSGADRFARLAAIIADHLGAPDILAVQEVQDDSGPEDDGTVSSERTLATLVEAVAAAGGPRYETRSIDPADGADGGQPGGNIRTAFLFNPARVEFVDHRRCGGDNGAVVVSGPSLACSPSLVDPDNAAFRAHGEGGGSRKPLVGEFRFAGRPVFLVNLHLVSKGGDDPIFGRRQPRVEGTARRRIEQAQVVAGFVEELLRADGEARVVVLGDLNDFEGTRPLRTLEDAGLEDLATRLPLGQRYSYLYLGNSQVLDHVLVSPALAAGAEIEMVHVNAEFPDADRASDHDPVIVKMAVGR